MNKHNMNNRVLSFQDFLDKSNLSESFFPLHNQYVPIAETILSNKNFILEEEQKCILEYVAYKKININDWILLKTNEGWFEDASNWFKEKIVKPVSNLASGAINWLVTLGSNIVNAIKSVVDKIMDGIQGIWEFVKLETNSWFGGNKSLKRQMTISVNQQLGMIKESLNETDAEKNRIIWDSLSKETGQLSNMFVESVNKLIKGEAFASKVTLSINKAVNESNVNKVVETGITSSILEMIPNAINEGILSIDKLSYSQNTKNIKSFKEVKKVNEVFEYIDKFYDWCIGALNNLPPFNIINNFVSDFQKNSNEMLETASKFLTDNFGVPGPYKFEMLGPVFSVLFSLIVEFGKYHLINKAIGFVVAPIPVIGPIVMFLLTIYSFFILGEIIMDVITGDFFEDDSTANATN